REPRRLPVARRGLARRAGPTPPAPRAAVDLRSAPRLVAARARGGRPLPRLSRAGRPARGLRRRDGLHPRRAPARDGAPVLRLVGLSDDRLLRALAALRRPKRFHGLRGPSPPSRGPRNPRLGAGALSARPARARLLGRHPPLRARDPRQREHPDWGTLIFN